MTSFSVFVFRINEIEVIVIQIIFDWLNPFVVTLYFQFRIYISNAFLVCLRKQSVICHICNIWNLTRRRTEWQFVIVFFTPVVYFNLFNFIIDKVFDLFIPCDRSI